MSAAAHAQGRDPVLAADSSPAYRPEIEAEEPRPVLPGAAEEDQPFLEGEFVLELQNDNPVSSDDRSVESVDVFTDTELAVDIHFLPPLFLSSVFKLETVFPPKPGDDRFFEDQGLFVEVLSLNAAGERWALLAGKFGPNFSIAYDLAPGIYGTDIAEDDIELSERIGFGGAYTFGNERTGRHTLSGSTFFADTSVLSDSVITSRGQLETEDGGPSNTESLESFVAAVDGEDLPGLPGLRYHLAVARQKVDSLGEDGVTVDEETGAETAIPFANEYRVALAGQWEIPVTEAVAVTPLLEYVRFWNATGVEDDDRNYLTAAALVTFNNWNAALAYTGRFIDSPVDGDTIDSQFQVSAGYTFDFGVTAEVGYRFLNEDEFENHVIGVRLTFAQAFGI